MWSHPSSGDTKAKKLICTRCRGTGTTACEFCSGKGEVVVGRDSKGLLKYGMCTSCYARKVARCRTCAGTGYT